MDINTLLPEVFINTGASEDVILHYLKRGAIDFFKESDAWQITVTNSLSANATGFTINPGSDNDFSKVISMKIGEQTLHPQTLSENQEGGTSYFYVDATGAVTFNKPLDIESTVTTKISITPKNNVIDDAMLLEYRDEIISACLSKMMLMPKKPWTDGNLGMVHEKKWKDGAAIARRKVFTGNSRVPLRTKSHFIGGK